MAGMPSNYRFTFSHIHVNPRQQLTIPYPYGVQAESFISGDIIGENALELYLVTTTVISSL
jgi:hypothetical protein